MRCKWFRKLAGVTTCSGLLAISGCYNMNGYVMNASGQGYYEQGNYAMAAQEFQTALANNPHNPDYMSNLAKARMKMGDTGSAEQMFKQALAKSPSHQPSYHGLAELYLANGRSNEAASLLNTWAATQPYVAESHVELAWLQRELGQPEAAAESLKSALQVNPSHSTALAHMGQYYQDIGQPAQALTMYQQSLKSDWNQPDVHSRMAVVAEAAGTNHPMSEMAMARGISPSDVPRQQLAFGQQNMMQPGMPQMNQPQMAFQPMPPQQQTMAFQPPFAQQQQANYPPSMAAQSNGYPMEMEQPWNAGPQVSHMSTNQMPMNEASGMGAMGMMIPFPLTGGTTTSVSSVSSNPQSTPQWNSATMQQSTASPMPTPDPAFQLGKTPSVPVTSISQSKVVSPGLPEIEAF